MNDMLRYLHSGALRKALALMLAFTLLLGLAACGAPGESRTEKQDVQTGDTNEEKTDSQTGDANETEADPKTVDEQGSSQDPDEGETMTGKIESGLWQKYALQELEALEFVPYPNEADYISSNGSFDSKGYSAAHDAWFAAVQEGFSYRDQLPAEALSRYSMRTMRNWLPGDGNNVYSPVNIYLALAMLAELTGGNSRAQILDLLGADSIEELRSWAQAIWKTCELDDGLYTSLLGSSVWLNDRAAAAGYVFNEEAVAALAVYYYASVFHGDLQDGAFMDAFRSWLSDQTHGLLDEQIASLQLDPETVLVIATTIYMKGQWQNEFDKFATDRQVFHSISADREVDFMHQSRYRTFYAGERFSAIDMQITNGGSMWVVLPDEGVSASELLSDEQALRFLNESPYENAETAEAMVNVSMPKFDVSSDLSLIKGLMALGITDVFDPETADFSPLLKEGDGLYVSQVQHAARVKADEEGFEAAAYTVIAVAGSAMPPQGEEIDFVCDRPFLFAIRDRNGSMMFAGIVNELE